MKDKTVQTTVVNKWTYLWLLCVPIGVGKIIYDSIIIFGSNGDGNIMQFAYDTFISIIIIVIGIGLFVKLNTFSQWMNPSHPKYKE